jgi:hypothetical protein
MTPNTATEYNGLSLIIASPWILDAATVATPEAAPLPEMPEKPGRVDGFVAE